MKESERIATLYLQLQDCDGILGKMEDMLANFHDSLGNITDEIRVLQERSMSMNIKLTNRKSAGETLKQYIQDMSIPPELFR